MNSSHRLRVAALAALAAGSLVLTACGNSGSSGAAQASAPGVTATTVTLGSHQPLTGIAAPGYDEIAPASNAYFQYVNAHGGVYGRKIVYKYLNDQYNSSITTTDVRQLILQDKVFAIFNGLGTPTHLAVAPFINAEKVPDLFVASGCACWNATSSLPETFGWQINYIREGKILGKYIATHFQGKKIAYFYQDDEFGQDGVKGLGYEIPASQVVAKEPYNVAASNPAGEVATLTAALKASGAQVVVAFAVPAFMALLRLSELSLNYSPTLVSSDVGSDPMTLTGLLNSFAKQSGSFGTGLIQGIITDSYLPSLGSSSDSWIQLFTKIHDQYIPKLPLDGNVLYGMSVAYTFVQALVKAGRNPTRQDLVNAVNGGLSQGVSVAPYAYSSSNHDGITGAYMAEIENGVLVSLGPTQVTDNSPSGAVSTEAGAHPPAPASVIPSPAGVWVPAPRPGGGARDRRGRDQGSVVATTLGRKAAGTAVPPAERLLSAAERLFGERSYRRTSVADICAGAGIATGSFYAHFASKADIFASVIRQINADVRAAMAKALDATQADNQRARERAAFRAYFDLMSSRPWVYRIVREAEFLAPAEFRAYYERLARGYGRGVRVAQLAGEVDSKYDPEVIAYIYTGIGHFVGMRWAEWTAGGRVPDDVFDDLMDVLARGLAPASRVTDAGQASVFLDAG